MATSNSRLPSTVALRSAVHPGWSSPSTRSSSPFPIEPKEGRRANFGVAAIVAPVIIGVVMALALHQLSFCSSPPPHRSSPWVHWASAARGLRATAPPRSRTGTHSKKARGRTSLRRRKLNARARLAQYPGPDEVVAIAMTPLQRLWERRNSDVDYLQLRLGTTTFPARARQIGRDGVLTVSDVPLVVDLHDIGVFGVVAPRPVAQGIARWLVLQAAVFHSPRDVELAILTGSEEREAWEWARSLPHTRDNVRVRLAAVASGDDATASCRPGQAGRGADEDVGPGATLRQAASAT